MYNDFFYYITNKYLVDWFLFGFFLAVIDIVFNNIMCFFTGGLQGIKNLKNILSKNDINSKTLLKKLKYSWFRLKGKNRVKEYWSDPIAVIYSFTILLLPTWFYGLSHKIINNKVHELNLAGIYLFKNRAPVFSLNQFRIQYFILAISIIIVVSTIFRYQMRSKKTWFSESLGFHIFRSVTFDIFQSYIIINIIVMWFDFFLSFFRVLENENMKYQILFPDQFYGLKPAYDLLILVDVVLVILSLLPIIMLFREKQQKYSWIYYCLIYGGLLSILILNIILVNKFNYRIEMIQYNEYYKINDNIDLTFENILDSNNYNNVNPVLQYILIINELPDSISFPQWFEYLLSLRLLLFLYELFILINKKELDTKIIKESFGNFLNKL